MFTVGVSPHDLFAPADPTDVFIFDVDISTHDAVKDGIVCTATISVGVTAARSLAHAALIASQIAGCHGMPTGATLVRVDV